MSASRTAWVVLKAMDWDSLEFHGIALTAPEGGPDQFIPVFSSEEKARAWALPDDQVGAITVLPREEG